MSTTSRAEAHLLSGPRSRHFGRVALLVLLAVMLTFGSAAALVYHNLQSNIRQTDVNDLLGRDPDDQAPIDKAEGRPLNILVLGSDIREGDSDVDGSGAAGVTEGMRADTTMLFHVSEDRSRVDVVSIPRDLLVDIPSCTVRTGEDFEETFDTEPSYDAMFNAAFSYGGQTGDVPSAAACSMKTVENMTGIHLDGYVVVNFASFKDVVEALGGIPMYFEEALYDEYAGLDVPAGCRLLDGEQSLALARARKMIGDGSDISRIGRQQELVFAIINEAKNMNLFTDLTTLYRVLQAATANLDTSEGLGDIPTLVGLANSMRNINLDNVNFITTPWEPAGNRVSLTPEASTLWNALAEDHPVSVATDESGNISVRDLILDPPTAPDPTPEDPTPSDPNSEEPGEETPSPEETTVEAAPAPSEEASTAPVCNRQNAQG
ncbi:LCP family protein [Actinomycetaceae bacterium L2_0104]